MSLQRWCRYSEVSKCLWERYSRESFVCIFLNVEWVQAYLLIPFSTKFLSFFVYGRMTDKLYARSCKVLEHFVIASVSWLLKEGDAITSLFCQSHRPAVGWWRWGSSQMWMPSWETGYGFGKIHIGGNLYCMAIIASLYMTQKLFLSQILKIFWELRGPWTEMFCHLGDGFQHAPSTKLNKCERLLWGRSHRGPAGGMINVTTPVAVVAETDHVWRFWGGRPKPRS